MKVMINEKEGLLSVYIPKKDLEEAVVRKEPAEGFGGTLELANGMKLYIEPIKPAPRLPITVEAKKV
ncbi:MAG: putative nitrogen fixation protein NifT [Candidatus Lambdaproteobacteria bacterium RIFOXYD2_FULL_50_16]|uniref:Putative nitrogen fixation protein NifT n=1 Tax=Candidatus Lambdaproteobacteria bacterium RIFOXYD2_FULL_50_16 TaxID=1817772 RepID=A0A1F6G8S2_9PROT|nr:MAG: putative nitrogen fixation protein NifT [Candidatus Lambdaproteobacteria bacterium RIFOXYD2_FULL_50_16]